MLQRNLVYTGVTRGKCLVVLVGQRKALAIAVKGARARRRWSKLGEWLIGGDRPSASVLMHQLGGSAGSRPNVD
jgi:exodeoxyribonuclease V alpha subunit